MDIMETFQPDIYQALCDGDTNKDSTKKRVQKSLDITHDFFRTCLERHKESKVMHYIKL
jgi:queuine/archaeosine tRNA-ribosyltransferase